MKRKKMLPAFALTVVAGFLICLAAPEAMAQTFAKMFSIPDTPETLLGPGQCFELAVPAGKKIVITDIYIENHGSPETMSALYIAEQAGPSSFQKRYAFRTKGGEVRLLNFQTGLRLGYETPIKGQIRVCNDDFTPHLPTSSILPRVNGYFTP